MWWNLFKNSYKIDFSTYKIHFYRCKLAESFKNIYPVGLRLWNMVLTTRVTEEVVEKIQGIEGVAQVIPNTGGYNLVIEVPSTFNERNVISMCALAVHNYYEEQKSPKKKQSKVTIQ